jgi:AcrR family transcriptional regulator
VALAKQSRSGVQLGEPVVRAMVMTAAARLFAQRGYRAVSVEDLLEAAKVSRRTFYKVFDGKDDVALALYRYGTDALVDASRKALSQDTDHVTRVLACVDLHLNNAARLGRLIYVLGGEASSQDSPLFAARMAVHDRMVEILRASSDRHVDPMFTRTLVLAIEAVVRCVLTEGDEGRKVTPEQIARARSVLYRVVTGAVHGEGPGVTPLPTLP